ncbi:MAG TPA: hypothetical protein VFH94_22255, partial [Streptomyces sp.]|nr:hypothetical protein [Streptomyces sp.]
MADQERERDQDQEPYQERELRDLLERVVPRLPSPEGRMDGVRRRVARRRQRRTAGAAVLAVAGIALAGSLLPDALRGSSQALPVPPATRPAAPSTTPVPSVRYPGLGGLGVRLPDGWDGLSAPGKHPTGFAANVPMAAHKAPCTLPPEQFCAPLMEKLGPGEGVIAFALRPDTLSDVGKESLFGDVQRQSGAGMTKSCVTV